MGRSPSKPVNWIAQMKQSRVSDFFGEIGVPLSPNGGSEAPATCFANPDAHRHDDRNRSVSVNMESGLWKCHGCGEAGNAYQAALYRGHSSASAAKLARDHRLFSEADDGRYETDKPPRNFTMGGATQWMKWMAALAARPQIIARLGELKGWTPAAIGRCGLGWDGTRITFVTTMPVGDTVKVVGVSRYLPNGTPKMLVVAGSQRTLFPRPEALTLALPLFVVEGEPDVVSVRSLGFQAVAVPGANAWKMEYAARLRRFKRLIVMCDCDEPGRELAATMKNHLPHAQVLDLEPSRDDGWDVGDLVAEAAREGGIWQARSVLERITNVETNQ